MGCRADMGWPLAQVSLVPKSSLESNIFVWFSIFPSGLLASHLYVERVKILTRGWTASLVVPLTRDDRSVDHSQRRGHTEVYGGIRGNISNGE